MNSPDAKNEVFRPRPGLWQLGLFWAMLFVICGLLGIGPYIGFYMFVLGSEDTDVLFNGMFPSVPAILALITLVEVLYQWIFKSSLMGDMAIAIFSCIIAAAVGIIAQYVLPFETRLDIIGKMFGFDGRHPLILVCEFSAASLSIIGGIAGFHLSRAYLRRFNFVY